jgi:hypothetical protein
LTEVHMNACECVSLYERVCLIHDRACVVVVVFVCVCVCVWCVDARRVSLAWPCCDVPTSLSAKRYTQNR